MRLIILFQQMAFGNRQMDLIRRQVDQFLAAYRLGFDIQTLEQFDHGLGLQCFTHHLKVMVAIDDFDAEAAFDLLDVVIERPAQAGQTLGVRGFQVQIQGGDMTAQGILSGN